VTGNLDVDRNISVLYCCQILMMLQCAHKF